MRRIEVGEFIESSLACGENPLAALAAYGGILDGDWAKTRPAAYPTGPLPHFSLNDKANAKPDAPLANQDKKPKRK